MSMDRSSAMLRHIMADLDKARFGCRDEAESDDYDEMVIWVRNVKAKGLIIDIPNDGIELS